MVTAPRVVGASTLALNPARALQPGADGRMVKEMKTNLPASIVKAPVAAPRGPSIMRLPGSTARRRTCTREAPPSAPPSRRGPSTSSSTPSRATASPRPRAGAVLLERSLTWSRSPGNEGGPSNGKTSGTRTSTASGRPKPTLRTTRRRSPKIRLQEIASALESERAKNKRGYDQNEDFDRRDERKISHLLPARHDRDTVACEARTAFHGEQERDYQGRPWCMPPRGGIRSRVDDGHDCFIPKRCIHRFTGHSKGVQRILPFRAMGIYCYQHR